MKTIQHMTHRKFETPRLSKEPVVESTAVDFLHGACAYACGVVLHYDFRISVVVQRRQVSKANLRFCIFEDVHFHNSSHFQLRSFRYRRLQTVHDVS